MKLYWTYFHIKVIWQNLYKNSFDLIDQVFKNATFMLKVIFIYSQEDRVNNFGLQDLELDTYASLDTHGM